MMTSLILPHVPAELFWCKKLSGGLCKNTVGGPALGEGTPVPWP